MSADVKLTAAEMKIVLLLADPRHYLTPQKHSRKWAIKDRKADLGKSWSATVHECLVSTVDSLNQKGVLRFGDLSPLGQRLARRVGSKETSDG